MSDNLPDPMADLIAIKKKIESSFGLLPKKPPLHILTAGQPLPVIKGEKKFGGTITVTSGSNEYTMLMGAYMTGEIVIWGEHELFITKVDTQDIKGFIEATFHLCSHITD